MTPQTYAQADRLLAGIPVERREPHRTRLYEHVAGIYRRARERNLNRVIAARDLVAMEKLRDLVCELYGVTVGQIAPARVAARQGPIAERHASARRVLVLAILEAVPTLALLDVAQFMRRAGRHSSIIWMRDNATETERAAARCVVNHWRAT